MKNESNNNISPESDDTEDIDLLDDFKPALKKEYIITIINKMMLLIKMILFNIMLHHK